MTQKMKTWIVGSMMLIFLFLILMFGVLAISSGQLSANIDSVNNNGILIADGGNTGGFDGG